MNRYLIERTIPGAGQLSSDELKAISQKSVEVISAMAPEILTRSLAGNLACCFCAGLATWTVHLMEKLC